MTLVDAWAKALEKHNDSDLEKDAEEIF